jgi:hypothetical protein
MKSILAIAAVLAFSSAVAFAEETAPQAPVQMTAAEMDQVVAGAGQQRLRDGSGDGVGDRLQIRDPSNCTK